MIFGTCHILTHIQHSLHKHWLFTYVLSHVLDTICTRKSTWSLPSRHLYWVNHMKFLTVNPLWFTKWQFHVSQPNSFIADCVIRLNLKSSTFGKVPLILESLMMSFSDFLENILRRIFVVYFVWGGVCCHCLETCILIIQFLGVSFNALFHNQLTAWPTVSSALAAHYMHASLCMVCACSHRRWLAFFSNLKVLSLFFTHT